MRPLLASSLLVALCCRAMVVQQGGEHAPTLLLNAQRFRRLQRDRDRQTVRWVNFEKRVQTDQNSPERGFELALYYAVTRDEARGREAVAWAVAHPCERRQVALVLDWVGELAPEALKTKVLGCIVTGTGRPQSPVIVSRDQLFVDALDDHMDPAQIDRMNKLVIQNLGFSIIDDPLALYAGAEYLITVRGLTHADPREQNAQFFSQLPRTLLLSLKPQQVEHPDWMTHIAALALVALDPNLENSQFLQGWAMEDRQTLREGPGVAYEFLWADPYLPGIAYQNMDPWLYNSDGLLFARESWEPNACWISVTARGQGGENCAAATGETRTFGTLTLEKAATACTNVAPRKGNETAILWGLKPKSQLTLDTEQGRSSAVADRAGMWSVPNEVTGKVCVNKRDRP